MGEQRILSVKELNRYIRMKFESDRLLQDVWIRGEISNFTHHSSGHMYFTLKDADSRIKCIMFASYNQRLAFIPKEGANVIARGNISIFERDGQYQFYVQQMQPDGIGNLYQAYEQLKRKLEAEGLFAAERKRQIPRYPNVIGVVTSPTGAAVRDILTTLTRRHPAVKVLLYPALVQGEQAAASIVRGIEWMNRLGEAEVLIVGRGGGSLEELWAFNEEPVVRAIAGSGIPVISAVGHETDFTLADFAADLRAATPTAAAELAVPHHFEVQKQLAHYRQRLHSALTRQVELHKEKLARLARSPFFLHPRRYLLQQAERLDRLQSRLQHLTAQRVFREQETLMQLERRLARFNPSEQIALSRERLAGTRHRLLTSVRSIHKSEKQKLVSLIRHLDALSPLKVMQRGYSLVYSEEKRLIKSVNDVELGDLLKVRLTDGELDCQVWALKGEED
jgi:exodeoxyribonuclease VII large subunit